MFFFLLFFLLLSYMISRVWWPRDFYFGMCFCWRWDTGSAFGVCCCASGQADLSRWRWWSIQHQTQKLKIMISLYFAGKIPETFRKVIHKRHELCTPFMYLCRFTICQSAGNVTILPQHQYFKSNIKLNLIYRCA